MTVITPSSYYSLFGTGTGSTNTGSPLTSPTQALVAALDNADSSTEAANSNTDYSLNLSPAAQTLLNTGNSSTTGSSSFTLTEAQQKKITDILEKYKDSPLTEATFDQIQSDLSAAGLGADQLMAQDETSSFDTTDSLISALNGNYSTSSASSILGSEQTKASNYLQSIVKEWQSISSAASSTSSGTNDSSSS